MRLNTLIKIIGGLGVELQDYMAEAAHKRFLALFEHDDDGTYNIRKDRIRLAQSLGFDVPRMVRRHLSSVVADELEFELDTSLHLTGDAEAAEDIDVLLKSGGLFRNYSSLKIKVKMKAVDPPEAVSILVNKVNKELHHETGRLDDKGEE